MKNMTNAIWIELCLKIRKRMHKSRNMHFTSGSYRIIQTQGCTWKRKKKMGSLLLTVLWMRFALSKCMMCRFPSPLLICPYKSPTLLCSFVIQRARSNLTYLSSNPGRFPPHHRQPPPPSSVNQSDNSPTHIIVHTCIYTHTIMKNTLHNDIYKV